MKIFVAGHGGMVGSAVVRALSSSSENTIIFASRSELDLLDQRAVQEFFKVQKIDQVYLAAAKVGGIHANNSYPAQFIYENLMIQANIIHAAHLTDVKKLLFMGSSCIYPKFSQQPIVEAALLTGILEPTNEPYAIAKIAGIKLCESYNRQYGRDYRSVMPTNLYGPNDNFHSENSHVIPAMLSRFHNSIQSKDQVIHIWGSGTPRREFLHVDDMAAACIHVMNLKQSVYAENTDNMLSHINIGSGVDVSIKELAETIAKVTGFDGQILYDKSKPDGAPRKLMDVSRLRLLGWQSEIGLEDGLRRTYDWFIKNNHNLRIK